MWNSAEPLSPSSWLKAQRPDEPVRRRARGSPSPASRGPATRSLEEPLDLVGPHRAVLVARQAGDLGVRVPAHGTPRRFSGTWRRRTTRSPSIASGNQRRSAPSTGTVYHRPHAPLERGRRAGRGHDPDLREDRAPGRLPPDPRRRRAADRRGLPDRPAVPRGRPAGDRPRLGGDREAVARVRRHRPPTPSAPPTTAPPTSAWPSADVLERRPATHRDPAGVADARRGRAAFAAIEAASGPARKARSVRGAARARLRPADGARRRQGPDRRAADRAARGPPRGGHRRRRSTGRSTP